MRLSPLVLALAAPLAAAQLQSGDLAVVGYASDNPDAVALVALASIPAGIEVALTDNGWQAAGSFRSNEGTFRYTVPAGGLAPGAVVRFDAPAGIAFSTSGDQVLVYTGPDDAPQFIYGLNNEGDGVWQDDATSSNTSALPTGLANGGTAIALVEADNAAYAGPTTGTRAELLALISDAANWSTSDDAVPPFPEAFAVTGDGGNLPPSFTAVLEGSEVVQGEPFAFDYDAADPDGDPLTFALVDGPAGAALDAGTGVLTWTPSAGQAGQGFEVVVSVTDGEASASTEATLTVLAERPGQPPAFVGSPPYAIVVPAGGQVTALLLALDENGESGTNRIVSGPPGAFYTDAGSFGWTTPDSAGVFDFVLEASNEYGAVQRPLFIATQRALFEGTQMGETRAAIRARFAPERTLGYDRGRDTLYARVEAFPDGVVEGVYTGYRVALPEGQDPSSYLFNNGINAEHTWPQSMGAADEPQRSDMHILYPARDNVNSARGNDPYAEIPDAETTTWYRRAEQRTTIPPDSIGTWSEDAPGRFEPRESVKGDVARAIFYFASVYESAASPSFLPEQLETLLAWHEGDPVDASAREEAVRSGLIQRYQGNPNPFILDPTLARRAFLPVLAAEGDAPQAALALSAPSPNPSRGAVRMRLTAGTPGPVRVEAFDVLGRRVAVLHDGPLAAGQRVPLVLDASRLAAGAYVVRAVGPEVSAVRRFAVAR
jgi:hypothetical protein